MREKVFKRDNGICAECGVDTKEREAEFNAHLQKFTDRLRASGFAVAERQAIDAAIKVLEEELGVRYRGPKLGVMGWEADHIEALAEGGEDDVKNLQTLCIPCHKKKSVAQQVRAGKLRRLVGKKAEYYRKMFAGLI